MAKGIGILAIGDELLDGRVVDTNTAYLGRTLHSLSLPLLHSLSCMDSVKDICSCLEFLSSRVDFIIVSGGLGPTSDDLTRDAIASFAGVELFEDCAVRQALEERYRKRMRSYDSSNNRQALFPKGARIIENPVGTAAGFLLSAHNNTQIFSLPGVPTELQAMFEAKVLPELQRLHRKLEKVSVQTLRCFGIPESTLGSIVTGLGIPETISASYRAQFPEIEIRLKSTDDCVVAEFSSEVASAIGHEFVVSRNAGERLPTIVHSLLLEHGLSLSTAESCTGGMIASSLTDCAGSSAYLLGGVVAYSNAVKESQLAVSTETLHRHGAVSREVATEMAEGCRRAFASDIAISVTGIAGPEGGSEEKPVGLFYLGLSTSERTRSFRRFFPSSRTGVRTFATFSALDLIRREVLQLELPDQP